MTPEELHQDTYGPPVVISVPGRGQDRLVLIADSTPHVVYGMESNINGQILAAVGQGLFLRRLLQSYASLNADEKRRMVRRGAV
jgi:hypothetical protein